MASRENKPDLVLIHGFVQDKRIFDRQIAYFGDRYRIHALDLRGHGRNQNEPGPYGNEEYTDDIQAYFDEQGLRNAIVWGTHTGTGVAINLYLREPSYIGRMILEGLVIPGIPTPEIDANIQRTKAVTREQGLEAAHTDWVETSGWYRYLNAQPEKARKTEQIAIVRDFAGRPWLSELPPRKPRDMSAELGRIACSCLAYNGAGHGLLPRDERDLREGYRLPPRNHSRIQRFPTLGEPGLRQWSRGSVAGADIAPGYQGWTFTPVLDCLDTNSQTNSEKFAS